MKGVCHFSIPSLGLAALTIIAVGVSSEATAHVRRKAIAPTKSTSLVTAQPQQSAITIDRIHSAALLNKIALKSAPTPAPAIDSTSSTTAANTPITTKSLGMMQTPMGYMATAPLNGLTSGSYVIVYGDGAVAAMTENGNTIWNHGSLDFTQWTGHYPPYQNGHVVIYNPVVPLGIDPIDPFLFKGEHPFATGDLTGDGIDDLAVAHYFSPGTNAIQGLGGTLVSVLDGNNGNLVWSHFYPSYVNNLVIDNAMLVVADNSGDVQGPAGIQIGENGSKSVLQGWQFSSGGTSVTSAWTVSTGVQWATWLALEKLPNGKIAAAWTNTAQGGVDVTHANELVVSTATGAIQWSVVTTNYPRRLRFDSTRNQVVAIEQADTYLSYAYAMVARNLNDGAIATTINEDNAAPINFQIGDLDGDGNADYVVTDVTYLANTLQNSGRILAINPTTGVTEWSRVGESQLVDPTNPFAGSDIPRTYGLLLVPTATGADVLAGSFIPGGNAELQRLNGALNLNGAAGAVLWSQSAPNLFLPTFMSIYQKAGANFVRVAPSRPHYYGGGISLTLDNLGPSIVLDGLTPYQVVRSFDAATGNQVSAVPLLGRIQAVAATDVNGDGKSDLIVGGESNAVFALDGNKIDSSPNFLWRRTVAGPIHQIEAADLDGDGLVEIVVAATHAIDVLDATTGNLRYEIPYAADYIWTFLLSDLLGNGKIDIVVPGSTAIRAYKPDGSALWNYTPLNTQSAALFSNVAITPDNIITAQFASGSQNPAQRNGGGFSRNVVGLNGATGALLWSDVNASDGIVSWFPQFYRGTVAGRLDGIAGSVVGYSFVGYDNSKDPPVAECDGCFTPAMEIRDAATGTIINSLPPPWVYNGSEGTVLVPEKGILSYGGNASWLLTPTQSGHSLGYGIPLLMQIGDFGPFGRHVVEQNYPYDTDIFSINGIDLGDWTTFYPWDTRYYHAIAPTWFFLRDIDGDGADEIIRTASDADGRNALVAAIQGFGIDPRYWSDGLDIVAVVPVPVQLNSVVSRKVHGSAGTFDINVDCPPCAGAALPATECRSGGPNGNYTLVFTFATPLMNVAGANVTNGAGWVSTANIDPSDAHNYIVNLNGVTNAQTLTVNLSDVTDSVGDFSSTISASMAVLIGDTTANRTVNSSDIAQTQSQSGQLISASNFRQDVTANGSINSSDIALVQSKSGTGLP